MFEKLFEKTSADVVVAGAGPVGQVAALMLAARNVDVAVLDEEWRPAGHSYAVCLHPDTLRLLDEVGVAEDLIDIGHRIDSVAICDESGRRATVRLDVLDAPFPFGITLPQSELERFLEEKLRARGIKVQWNHRVARIEHGGSGLEVHVDRMGKASVGYAVSHTEKVVEAKYAIDAKFLIGADGHRSLVRRQREIEFPEVGPARVFAAFEGQSPAAANHEGQVILDEKGRGSVFWPMPDNRWRWSFEIDDTDAITTDSRYKSRLMTQFGERSYPYLSDHVLPKLIELRAPWFDYSLGEVEWSIVVRFEQRLVESFGDGRIWLAGDAGHLAGPVAGQSMNVGLREAHELAWRLGRVLHGNAGEAIMRDYNADRLAEWRGLLGLGEALTRNDGVEPWVAGRAESILPTIPSSGAQLALLLDQIGLSFG